MLAKINRELMRTIKEEQIELTEYQDFTDSYAQIGCFLDQVYRHKRIHSALGYLTPAEFERDWLNRRAEDANYQYVAP